MYSKILCVIALACAVAGQAAQFPAGVDPSKCPSYPNCDNSYLHNVGPQQQQQQWNAPQQQWNAPQQQWNAPQQNWNQPEEDWTQWDEPSNGAWSGESNQNQWNQNQWNAPAQNQWNAPAQNQWNAPQQNWNAPQNQWNAPALQGPSSNHLPGAAKFPAGVNPQQCPNYPYCDGNLSGGHGQVAPLPGWTERVYPAGVNPQQCPNYPLCN